MTSVSPGPTSRLWSSLELLGASRWDWRVWLTGPRTRRRQMTGWDSSRSLKTLSLRLWWLLGIFVQWSAWVTWGSIPGSSLLSSEWWLSPAGGALTTDRIRASDRKSSMVRYQQRGQKEFFQGPMLRVPEFMRCTFPCCQPYLQVPLKWCMSSGKLGFRYSVFNLKYFCSFKKLTYPPALWRSPYFMNFYFMIFQLDLLCVCVCEFPNCILQSERFLLCRDKSCFSPAAHGLWTSSLFRYHPFSHSWLFGVSSLCGGSV